MRKIGKKLQKCYLGSVHESLHIDVFCVTVEGISELRAFIHEREQRKMCSCFAKDD